MKVQALTLGIYDATCIFRLYRFPMPVSPPLNSPTSASPTQMTAMQEMKPDQSAMYYYCLEDLERLAILAPAFSFRHVNTVQLYREYPSAFCKNVIDGYTYANVHVLCELASCFKSKLLVDLCQLTEHTPLPERYSLLQQIPLLDTTSVTAPSLLSPALPPSLSLSSRRLTVQLVEHVLHPVRLGGQEWFLQPWIQQQYEHHQRLSPPRDEHPSSHLPNVCVTDMSSRTKESSLLLQRRLAPKLGHHAPHLTIHTPTYKDHCLHAIKSAPLRKSISKQQMHKRLQAAAVAAVVASHDTNTQPAPSSVSAPRRYPHHACPQTARSQMDLGPSNHATHPPTSSMPTTTTAKQSFTRTFEQFYGTLQQTQAQTSTLDNTIRQTSARLETLQHCLTPQRTNEQVITHMDEWLSPYLDQIEQCMGRLLMLESKMAAKQQQQQLPTTTTTILPAKSDDKTTTMKMELLALMNRLERLEQGNVNAHFQ